MMSEQPEMGLRGGENDDKSNIFMWSCLCHFSALLGLIWWLPLSNLWIPFGHLLGPLAVWLIKRKLSPFVDEAGKESLNFQIMMTLYGIAIASPFSKDISRVLIMGLVLLDVYCVITAGLSASKGNSFKYPLVFWRVIR